jgi:hypothetical protein
MVAPLAVMVIAIVAVCAIMIVVAAIMRSGWYR